MVWNLEMDWRKYNISTSKKLAKLLIAWFKMVPSRMCIMSSGVRTMIPEGNELVCDMSSTWGLQKKQLAQSWGILEWQTWHFPHSGSSGTVPRSASRCALESTTALGGGSPAAVFPFGRFTFTGVGDWGLSWESWGHWSHWEVTKVSRFAIKTYRFGWWRCFAKFSPLGFRTIFRIAAWFSMNDEVQGPLFRPLCMTTLIHDNTEAIHDVIIDSYLIVATNRAEI